MEGSSYVLDFNSYFPFEVFRPHKSKENFLKTQQSSSCSSKTFRKGRGPVSLNSLSCTTTRPTPVTHSLFGRPFNTPWDVYPLNNLLPYSWVDVRVKTVFHEPPHNTWFTHTCILKENEVVSEVYLPADLKTTSCHKFRTLENSSWIHFRS